MSVSTWARESVPHERAEVRFHNLESFRVKLLKYVVTWNDGRQEVTVDEDVFLDPGSITIRHMRIHPDHGSARTLVEKRARVEVAAERVR